jgi:hypothetical protein
MLKTVVPFMISVPFMTQTLPPGDLGFPGIGETIAFFRDRQFALRRHQRHGPVFKTSIFGQKTVFLQGAEGNRFDGDRAEDKQKPFGHVPFGGGLRECIGKEFARLEIKLFAARLLRGYGWELLPDQDLEMVVIPTPKPRDGLKVRFWKL